MHKATLFRKEGNSVRCLACAHHCLISVGKTGICAVRKNNKGKLFLLVYQKPCAVHIDPIEKKPLYHFLPRTRTLSLGTVGCNFKCEWCQNFDISQTSKSGEISGYSLSPKQAVSLALKHNCPSISYTYNEPTIWVEYVHDIAVLAKKKILKNVMVTNGYWSEESFDYLKDVIDAVNIDLKSFSDETYIKFCGAKLQPVLETIKRTYKSGMHVEITTLIIPGINDSEKELKQIAEFIASVSPDIPWHISRFFPMYNLQDKEFTPLTTLKRADSIGKKYLKYVHLGNV